MNRPASDPLLTLEPLIEAVRAGVTEVGWELSGLQKTTSHQFEGRWEGDSTRSAYLFFHKPHGPDWASVDVYLDETSRGLTGNLALVVDTRPLGELGDVSPALAALGGLAVIHLPDGYRTPVTLRLRLEDAGHAPADAASEVRFKLRIPATAVNAGADAVTTLARATVRTFDEILTDPGLEPFVGL